MGPTCGPLPPSEGSDVWALGLYRVYKGYIRGTPLRVDTKGPCNYCKSIFLVLCEKRPKP